MKRINDLLLKTAFACMACDGDIDKREVELIRKLHDSHQTFGNVDIVAELDNLLQEINAKGNQFFKEYFTELSTLGLNEDEELKLVEVAIETIKADDKIEYSEVKFFKLIRSKLNISNNKILDKHPDFEDYLEDDIFTDSYLARFEGNFFEMGELPKFDLESLK